jgi:hypothetical protein
MVVSFKISRQRMCPAGELHLKDSDMRGTRLSRLPTKQPGKGIQHVPTRDLKKHPSDVCQLIQTSVDAGYDPSLNRFENAGLRLISVRYPGKTLDWTYNPKVPLGDYGIAHDDDVMVESLLVILR